MRDTNGAWLHPLTRCLARLLALLTVLAPGKSVLVAGVLAQDYPGKPVKILIAFAPGGPSDIVGRLLARKLTENLGGKPFRSRESPWSRWQYRHCTGRPCGARWLHPPAGEQRFRDQPCLVCQGRF